MRHRFLIVLTLCAMAAALYLISANAQRQPPAQIQADPTKRLEALEAANKQQQQKNEALQKELTETKFRLTLLETALKSVTQDGDANKANLANLKSALADLQNQVTKFHGEFASHKHQLTFVGAKPDPNDNTLHILTVLKSVPLMGPKSFRWTSAPADPNQ